MLFFFLFKQKTAYEMRISDWSSDVCSSDLLHFTGLADLAKRPASELTLANRKRLELAKGLAMNPHILLLDEVNAGLNTAEIERALDLIRAIAARGISIDIGRASCGERVC